MRRALLWNFPLLIVFSCARTALGCASLLASSVLRHGQLGTTRVHSLIRVDPADPLSDLIANYAWGKTLRSGSRHPVRVSRLSSDEVLCPVRAITEWFRAARAMGWDMSKGYVFSPIMPNGARSLDPGSAPDMHLRFKRHLASFYSDDGETLHGTCGVVPCIVFSLALRRLRLLPMWVGVRGVPPAVALVPLFLLCFSITPL